LALVENNCGSRIIVTTRIQEVAEEAGEFYKLQHLSDDNSRKLFFARIFGGESKSSDQHLDDDVSKNFLSKCGGIPLAIITMASLLVGKPMEEWSGVHRSIGFANKGNYQVENTEKIISFSYYDLPSHLRTCLLYLSVFPEDYFIEIRTLVWMWVAEGFVQEKQGMTSFEIGEGYFNELVNRSMIQMAEKEDMLASHLVITTCGCRVHDMVLDLICSISSEENFVTILEKNGGESSSSQGKVRRLALQNDRTLKANMEIQQVRSFISWEWDVDKGISPLSFKLVRVLALHGTYYSYYSDLEVPFRNLLHLRYLRVSAASIVFQAEIGTLTFLQTLDVGQAYGMAPTVTTMNVGLLTKLLCLRIRNYTETMPDGFGKLTSLEDLEMHYQGHEEAAFRRFVKELCGLRELRVLHLHIPHWWRDEREVQNDMVQSLCSLQNLEILALTISGFADGASWVWEAPPQGFLLSRRLQRLSIDWIVFLTSPTCPWKWVLWTSGT
jgi:disease resistance protein RPM1